MTVLVDGSVGVSVGIDDGVGDAVGVGIGGDMMVLMLVFILRMGGVDDGVDVDAVVDIGWCWC
jgi:hypothetical protein